MITNYKDFTKFLSTIDQNNKPRLLIHSCCAPCATHVLFNLKQYFEIDILFYNPNIYPKTEYDHRLEELKTFLKEAHLDIQVYQLDYRFEDFLKMSKGLENEKEGGKRCFLCYEMRMREACIYAKEHHYDYFSTVLSISPYKNSDKINEIGYQLEEEYQVKYLYSNFKKEQGYLKSIEYSKEYQLYRQDYCGCPFSKRDGLLKRGNKDEKGN